MTKISQEPLDSSPGLTDYVVGNSAAVPTTQRFLWSAIKALFLNNAWASYTPTVTLVGGGSVGNSVISGAWVQIGKTVHFWANFVGGSTSSFSGCTAMYLSLPTAMTSQQEGNIGSLATGLATGGGNGYDLLTENVNTTTIQLIAKLANGTYVELIGLAAAVPFAWGANATWSITGTYEAT